MRRPRIGIPLGLDDRGRWRPGRSYVYLDRGYADAIQRAGGIPLHLPIQDDPASLLDEIDGLLLPGGDDLPPDLARGEEQAEAFELDLVPEEQLAFDGALLDSAFRARRPILGICYGMQLLARAGGGRIDTHLPSQRPEASDHKLASSTDRHGIEIEPDSRLARIMGRIDCKVNSLHHQAVSAVGTRHRIVARSPDGVIEAIEATANTETFELGVQWHPEKLDPAESAPLFAHFVSACRDRAQSDQDR
jgi:putative glutamine amidotransferase